MNAQMVLTMGQDALLMLLMVSAPVLGTALIVGLLVSLFQAITQIHEATLTVVAEADRRDCRVCNCGAVDVDNTR